MKRLAKALAARLGIGLINTRKHYSQDGLYSFHNPRFQSDPGFQAAYKRGVEANLGHDPRTEWRTHIALWTAKQALSLPGDFVECGVNNGFQSSAIMQYLDWNKHPGRRFFLIDTFNGPVTEQFSPGEVAAGRLDLAQSAVAAGSYATDVARVQRNFSQWPNAIVIPGAVPGILKTVPASGVAFLHIDMNCALPETAALEFFWPLLSPGAFVLLDDYAFYGHQIQGDEMDRLAQRLGSAAILSLPTGQGLLRKDIPPTSGTIPPAAS